MHFLIGCSGTYIEKPLTNRYSYGLSPKELAEAKRNVIKGDSSFYLDARKMVPNGRMDNVSRELFVKALTQLEIINQAVAKVQTKTMNSINKSKEEMEIGQSKTWQFKYKDINGNDREMNLGIEKREVAITKTVISEDTHEEMKITEYQPAYRYYILNNNQDGQDKQYISESDFNNYIGDYNRCNV